MFQMGRPGQLARTTYYKLQQSAGLIAIAVSSGRKELEMQNSYNLITNHFITQSVVCYKFTSEEAAGTNHFL